MRTMIRLAFAATVAAVAVLPQSADAIRFSGASIESWRSCDNACRNSGSLTYTHNQIDYFDKIMRRGGHTKAYKFRNTAVNADQYIEDRFGGQDYKYVDSTTLHAYSGHGWSSGADYSAPLCKANGTGSCWIDSDKIVLGERTLGYHTPNPGELRWLMLLTCYSVHKKPNYQWSNAIYNGTEYIMGYRGLSADSSNTDEVAGDWASEAMKGSKKFKASWFWAIEDFWGIDDTGAVVGGGQTRAGAIKTRDQMRRTWNRRTTNGWTWFAWSWHEG